MAQAKSGDEVSVHYKGRFEDGTVFDQSDPDKPLKFTLGNRQVIAGFERAVAAWPSAIPKRSPLPRVTPTAIAALIWFWKLTAIGFPGCRSAGRTAV